jgi:hypothetical protein
MNTQQLAKDFAALFVTDAAFVADHICTGDDSSTYKLPAIVLSATAQPFDAAGNAARFTLTAEVRSPAAADGADGADAAHAARIAKVRAKLLTTGKATSLAAMHLSGRWLIPGWGAGDAEDGLAGNRFETPVRLSGTIVAL